MAVLMYHKRTAVKCSLLYEQKQPQRYAALGFPLRYQSIVECTAFAFQMEQKHRKTHERLRQSPCALPEYVQNPLHGICPLPSEKETNVR